MWMVEHGRVYKDDEERAVQFAAFRKKWLEIEAFNSRPDRGYKLGINQFSDCELNPSSCYMMETRSNKNSRYSNVPPRNDISDSWDWSGQGAVTPVKNQLNCVAKPEAGQTGPTNSSLITREPRTITRRHNPTCNRTKWSVQITSYVTVKPNDKEALRQAVVDQPITVAVDASSCGFKDYCGGVYSEEDCKTKLSHAITVVGYGVTDEGTKFWILKNSWGTKWGDDKYMRLKRDMPQKEGLCGIAMDTSYPVIDNYY
ncbi:Senescence-specific cysteine protease SAG12 [Striga hermonthica]|uniref:Senescence-specific cysteine protease SAG12 n=1 Tax=Striga hermonthica TaxID=68872 RepID=A0A9N7N694_STRHE|nr:Senescence-specific cysteine protease SAG12 [Striga hermonthica]